MLVLTRKPGQSIKLFQGAELIGVVNITAVNGDRARVGLEFGDKIRIVRSELEEQPPAAADTQPAAEVER
jgi:sRNA-binding carbon storage regulator CsrA